MEDFVLCSNIIIIIGCMQFARHGCSHHFFCEDC